MLTALQLLPVGLRQAFAEQELRRRPERTAAMNEADAVDQYNALDSNLIITYAACLKAIYRARRQPGRIAAPAGKTNLGRMGKQFARTSSGDVSRADERAALAFAGSQVV